MHTIVNVVLIVYVPICLNHTLNLCHIFLNVILNFHIIVSVVLIQHVLILPIFHTKLSYFSQWLLEPTTCGLNSTFPTDGIELVKPLASEGTTRKLSIQYKVYHTNRYLWRRRSYYDFLMTNCIFIELWHVLQDRNCF